MASLIEKKVCKKTHTGAKPRSDDFILHAPNYFHNFWRYPRESADLMGDINGRDKKNWKFLINLKLKGLDRVSPNFVLNLTKSWCIRALNFILITWNLHKLKNLEQIFKKSKISKNLNTLIDFGQIQY